MSTPPRRWISHKPEQRLSIVVSRFLNDALVPPFYATSIHDADEGTRTDRQRARDRERGQMPGQLDWDVAQGPGLWRKLELKRGKNKLSENQLTTFRKLNECGMMPVLAYDLQQAWRGLAAVGFRFTGNVSTLLQKYEAQLEALDRAAEADQPAKLRRAPKKQGPRAARPGKWYRKANAQGLI